MHDQGYMREREKENDHRGEICLYIYICPEKKETSFEFESSDRWKDGALARINLCTCIYTWYVCKIYIYIYMYAKYIDMCVYVHVNMWVFRVGSLFLVFFFNHRK